MWARIELNIIRALPLLIARSEGFQSEVVLKYFLTQAWASLVFIWTMISALKLERALYTRGATLALLLKVGVAPLHLWFIRIIKTLDWKTFVIISTAQKVIPLYLLFLLQVRHLLKRRAFFCCIRVLSVGGLKLLKKVIAVSSVFRLAWLLVGGLRTSALWVIYLGIYTLGLIILTVRLEAPIERLRLRRLKEVSWRAKLSVFLSLIVLAGLPPFVGFYGKVLVFSYGLGLGEGALCAALLGGAVWMMYIYVRRRYPLLASGEHSMSRVDEGQVYNLSWLLLIVVGSLGRWLRLGLCTGVLAHEILNFKGLG